MDAPATAPFHDVTAWHRRPVPQLLADQHAFTVDVEDYFQVEALSRRISREEWDEKECRIEASLDRVLQLCDEAGAKGTFFTLGWIGRRYKHLVRRIVDEGHELASHGHDHVRADRLSIPDFIRDIHDAKKLLEDVSGAAVLGYRAPCFSIGSDNLWALNVIREVGYRYSSSIYPIRHDAYGLPSAPRHAFRPFTHDPFVEIPVSSVRLMGRNWPCGGGGYFRLLPLSWSLAAMDRISRSERRACIFYFHPWEIDPGQPRLSGLTMKSRLRHYTNLGRMEARIARLLRHFSWNRIDRIFPVDGIVHG
jgi:polysaccharide deacetylase family protein (PEP-CTERM system associated)